MKDRMKLIDKIQTPDDWKDRAKKIAQGKGIYAKVKTGGWWKAAIAAALALVIGAEGFLLLREDKGDKADKEKITVPTMTDSREAHETENSLLVKQMSYYYPRATEERCKELAAELKKNGCGLIYTRDNGIAQSCSQELAAHTEDIPYYMEEYSRYKSSCEGYIITGSTLTAFLRMEEDSDILAYGTKWDINEDFAVHACIYDKNTGTEIKPKSSKMSAVNGGDAWYVRIDISLTGRLPESGFDDLITDIHLYNVYSVGEFYDDEFLGVMDDDDIKNTNDERYGIYHMDIKVEPSEEEINVSSDDDAFDTILKAFDNDVAGQYYTIEYYHDNVKTQLAAGTPGEEQSVYSAGDDIPEGTDKGYTDGLQITSPGYLTDGYSAYMLFYANGKAGHLKYRQYLMPEGILLGENSVEPSKYEGYPFCIGVGPEYALGGHTVKTVIYADGEEHDESSLHYVFEYDIPEDIKLWKFEDEYDREWDKWLKKDKKTGYSTLGIFVAGADEEIAKHQKAVAETGDKDQPLLAIHLGLDENIFCVMYDEKGDTTVSGRIFRIKDASGKYLGYYINYGRPCGYSPSVIVFSDDGGETYDWLCEQG